MHTVAPEMVEYVPVGHSMQVGLFCVGVYFPALHKAVADETVESAVGSNEVLPTP